MWKYHVLQEEQQIIRKCDKSTSICPILAWFWRVYSCASPVTFWNMIKQHIKTLFLQKKLISNLNDFRLVDPIKTDMLNDLMSIVTFTNVKLLFLGSIWTALQTSGHPATSSCCLRHLFLVRSITVGATAGSQCRRRRSKCCFVGNLCRGKSFWYQQKFSYPGNLKPAVQYKTLFFL